MKDNIDKILRECFDAIHNEGLELDESYDFAFNILKEAILSLLEATCLGLLPPKIKHPSSELPAEKYWIYGHNKAIEDITGNIKELMEDKV